MDFIRSTQHIVKVKTYIKNLTSQEYKKETIVSFKKTIFLILKAKFLCQHCPQIIGLIILSLDIVERGQQSTSAMYKLSCQKIPNPEKSLMSQSISIKIQNSNFNMYL